MTPANKKIFKFIIGGIITLAVTIVGTMLWHEGYEYYQYLHWQHQKASVVLQVEYAEEECPPKRPLLVTTTNGSDYSVNNIRWDVGVFKPGYSTDLTISRYREFSHDKVLMPSESWEQCTAIPELDVDLFLKAFEDINNDSSVMHDLRFTIQRAYVAFNKRN